MKDEEKREQVARQCEAVAHMARAIAEVHTDKAMIVRTSKFTPVDLVGQATAQLMETLGNILNGMDAVTDEDEWISPIFEKAHQLWPAAPHSQRLAQGGTE